jgi:putative addiction module killer protein/probable addiction module antidote protein
VCFDNV